MKVRVIGTVVELENKLWKGADGREHIDRLAYIAQPGDSKKFAPAAVALADGVDVHVGDDVDLVTVITARVSRAGKPWVSAYAVDLVDA